MSETPELLPCPFCGAKRGDTWQAPLEFNEGDEGGELPWHVFYWKCSAQGARSKTREAAITAWNTRARPAMPEGMREAVARLRERCGQFANGSPINGGDIEDLEDVLDFIAGGEG